MKAVVKTRKEPGVEVLDVDVPQVTDTDILVKIHAGSLCGSDVHVYEWTPNCEWMPVPVILGHEFSGEVVEVGSKVQSVAVGERITALPSMPCSRWSFFQVGKSDSCTNRLNLQQRIWCAAVSLSSVPMAMTMISGSGLCTCSHRERLKLSR